MNDNYGQDQAETGVGVAPAANVAPQPDCATVAIGLGGTGIDALRRLKGKVSVCAKSDDSDAAEPACSHIRFLAVDADVHAMRHHDDEAEGDDAFGRLDLQREFFDISYRDSISRWFWCRRVLLAKDPCYNEWLQFDEIKADAADNGAGGIRQLGRFLLFQRAGQFVDTVKRLIVEARTGLPEGAPLHVCVFSGMSGGTGSGTFLDVCYLVRYAISQLGIGNATVTGYFFLPDVSLKPGLGTTAQSFIKANGYAAMQELDYCMSFEDNDDSWHQEYPGVGLVESSRQPVDLCCLVSGTSNGDASASSYDSALDVAAESAQVLGAEIASGSTDGAAPLQAVESLLHNKIGVRVAGVSTDATRDYIVLGDASAEIRGTSMPTDFATDTPGRHLYQPAERVEGIEPPASRNWNLLPPALAMKQKLPRSVCQMAQNSGGACVPF